MISRTTMTMTERQALDRWLKWHHEQCKARGWDQLRLTAEQRDYLSYDNWLQEADTAYCAPVDEMIN